MSVLSASILRHWQAALGLAVAAILSILLAIRTDQRDDARAALAAERRAGILFAERVRSKAEEVARRFAEHGNRVARDQVRISQEVSHDYQARIDELGRRVAALRLRAGAGGTNPGGTGRDDMPDLSEPARGADAAASDPGFSLERRAVATEQAIRLEALQRWIRQQQGVKRSR